MLQTLSDTVRSTLRAIRRREIENLVRQYELPRGLRSKVAVQFDLLDERALDRIFLGLKEYFLLCLDRDGMALGMPSRVVDAAWHAFILHTRDYTEFCQRTLGSYLHHMPNAEQSEVDLRRTGREAMDIGRTWILSCIRSGQDPRRPTEVPLLFALDAELGIVGGKSFTLDDLAALPIPPGFIETEPGRYRFIGNRKHKRRKAQLHGDPQFDFLDGQGEKPCGTGNLPHACGDGGGDVSGVCSGGSDGH